MMQASPLEHLSPEERAKLADLFNQRTADPTPEEPSRFTWAPDPPKKPETWRVCGACGLHGKFVTVNGEIHHQCATVAAPRQGAREMARRARRMTQAVA